jgi:hypothetical protein
MSGHGHEPIENPVFGIVAEFDNPDTLLHAATVAAHAGYKKMDAYSPFPIHGLAEAIPNGTDDRVPWFAFFGGCTGFLLGIGLNYFINVIDYPMNVGGKPLFAWPQFLPIIFEMTVLCTGLTTFISQWALNGLPRLNHPIFNAKNFDRATQDRFFLCIESKDPKFEPNETTNFLNGLHPIAVSEVRR